MNPPQPKRRRTRANRSVDVGAGEDPGSGAERLDALRTHRGPATPATRYHLSTYLPLLSRGQREVKQAVGAIALGEAVTEVSQHAVMEAGIIQLHGQGVLEIDTATHRLNCLPVGQIKQKLQHTDRGQLSGRETGRPSRGYQRTTAPRQLHRPLNKADHAPHLETKITDRVKLSGRNWKSFGVGRAARQGPDAAKGAFATPAMSRKGHRGHSTSATARSRHRPCPERALRDIGRPPKNFQIQPLRHAPRPTPTMAIDHRRHEEAPGPGHTLNRRTSTKKRNSNPRPHTARLQPNQCECPRPQRIPHIREICQTADLSPSISVAGKFGQRQQQVRGFGVAEVRVRAARFHHRPWRKPPSRVDSHEARQDQQHGGAGKRPAPGCRGMVPGRGIAVRSGQRLALAAREGPGPPGVVGQLLVMSVRL